MFFQQIFEEKLAQYAYLIGCQVNGEAIIIDPMRDIERYKQIAAKHNLKITAAADTHIHADYLTGLREFAEEGVKVYVSDEGGADWRYEWVLGSGYNYQLLKNGDEFSIGNIRFKALHTPGHTPEHMIYKVTDGAATNEPMGILSGDFVFVGDVGRPDLLETAAGQTGVMESSARALFDSVRMFKTLPEYLQLWPGHGAGSACGKALGAVPDSTVGYEQRFNNSVRAAETEDNFVDYILSGQPEPPLYFARMKRDNKLGPEILGEIAAPEKLSAEQINELAARPDAVLLDTRLNRSDFMTRHLKGALYVPFNKSFSTVAGSYVKEDQDIYLIIGEEDAMEAKLDLIRIGLDKVKGFTTPEELEHYCSSGNSDVCSIPVIDFKQADERVQKNGAKMLDVRNLSEFSRGHYPEALNIAHTRLMARLADIPKEAELCVSCQSGGRAAAAAALLEREGYNVLFIDDAIEPWLQKHHKKTI